MRKLLKNALVLFVTGTVGFAAAKVHDGTAKLVVTESVQSQLVVTEPAVNPPETEIHLLGVTPEGVKVYRLRQAKFIVPAYVAVAPNGSVAIR